MEPLEPEWEKLAKAVGAGEGADSMGVAKAKAELQIRLTHDLKQVIGDLSTAIRAWTASSDRLGRKLYGLNWLLVLLTLALVVFGILELR